MTIGLPVAAAAIVGAGIALPRIWPRPSLEPPGRIIVAVPCEDGGERLTVVAEPDGAAPRVEASRAAPRAPFNGARGFFARMRTVVLRQGDKEAGEPDMDARIAVVAEDGIASATEPASRRSEPSQATSGRVDVAESLDDASQDDANAAAQASAEEQSLARHRAWSSEVDAREAAVAAETEAALRRQAEAALAEERRASAARQVTIESLSARLAEVQAALEDSQEAHANAHAAAERERASAAAAIADGEAVLAEFRKRIEEMQREVEARTEDVARFGRESSEVRETIAAYETSFATRLGMPEAASAQRCRLATSLGAIRDPWMEAFLWAAWSGEADEMVRARLLGSLGRGGHFRDAGAWEHAWREGTELERCAIAEVLEGRIAEAPWIGALLQRLRSVEAEAVVV